MTAVIYVVLMTAVLPGLICRAGLAARLHRGCLPSGSHARIGWLVSVFLVLVMCVLVHFAL